MKSSALGKYSPEIVVFYDQFSDAPPDVCTSYRDDPLIVFPKLTYSGYNTKGIKTEESTLNIAMRVWYPDDLLDLVRSSGFEIRELFGGYKDEKWEEGSELVVSFGHSR